MTWGISHTRGQARRYILTLFALIYTAVHACICFWVSELPIHVGLGSTVQHLPANASETANAPQLNVVCCGLVVLHSLLTAVNIPTKVFYSVASLCKHCSSTETTFGILLLFLIARRRN